MAPSGGATRAREYGSRRVTYDEDEYNFEEEYGRLSDDDAYDPMQHVQDDLRKTMAHAKSARSTKEKRRPVKEVSTLNNALQAMYEDEVAFFDEEQVVKDAASYRFRDDDSAEDTSGGIETSNSVFTLAEKRQGALEGLRAKARFKHATTYAQNDVKQKLIVDYGTTDASEWVPHVFSDGGGSVAWFKSRDAMTTEERIAADIAADRAEGISGISGTVRTVRVTKEDLPKNIEVESGADVERVLRVTKRAEVLVRKIDDDAEQTGQGDVLTQGLNQELPTQPRRRGIRAAGRRVVMSNTLKKEGESKKQSTHTYENIFPPGGVRAPRGLPHEPPDTRGKTRVVERPIACGVNGEIVETTAGDVDFNRRPEESDLVVQETTTQTRDATSNFVTMDEHGNVIGHGETLRENKRTVADADGNELEVDVNDDDDHGDIPNRDTDQESFDAMKLTDGQVDIVVELLRDKHGMEVTSEKLRGLLSLIKTKKKYYGVDADAWQEKGDEQTAAEEDGSIAALLGNLLTGLFAEEKPGPPKPRPKFSANVVFDKQLDPVVEARLRASSAGASGLLARRDAKPGASRGAWRSARRATDLGASRDPRGDFLCTTVMSAMERQHIIDGETKASIDRAKKLADLKPNKWKVLGAFGVFTGTMTEAARLAKEYREEEEAEYRLPNPKPKPKPQQKTMTERRKLVDAKGNVVEVMEEKKVTLDNSNSSKFESMADMIKKREAQDLAEGRPRCICYDAQSEPVVSGGMGGKKTRGFGGMGGRKKRTALAKTVKNCPVHFPFGDKPIKTVPTKPPNKTHAVSDDTKTSEPAARNDDAGYVLYETSQYFYLASHDHTRSKWRLAKIARRADTLEVDEHGLVYDREQLKELMSAVHKGNDASGGLRVVTQGAGVVALVELAAKGGDDPASAKNSGPEAVIKRAEELHRERTKEVAQRNDVETEKVPKKAGVFESAEAEHAGGAKGFKKTAGVVFSGVATQSVRRKGRVRTQVVGEAKSSRETEMDEALKALSNETNEKGVPNGKAPKHPAHDQSQVLDPGEGVTVGMLRLYRLTIGHASSLEPESRLNIGKQNAALTKRESRRIEEQILAKKEEEELQKKEPSYFARVKTKAYRNCVYRVKTTFFKIFGKDALEEDEAFFERRRRILRDRERPTVAELRAARLHNVDMKLLEQPEDIVEDGPLTELSDWFGNDWWFWNKDSDEDKHKIDTSRTTHEASNRRRDPLLVKLRFRQYAQHDDAAK